MPALKGNGNVIPLESQVAILDTGTSHIRVPAQDMGQLTKLMQGYSSSCSINEAIGYLECYCGLFGSIHDFPNIYLNFVTPGTDWWEIAYPDLNASTS